MASTSSEARVLDIGWYEADADYSAKLGYAVKRSATGMVLSGAGEAVVGIIENAPADEAKVNVRVLGVAAAYAGDTITAGQQVMANASGQLVPLTSTNAVAGVALEAAASGQLFSLLLGAGGKGQQADPYSEKSYVIAAATIANGDIATDMPLAYSGTIENFYAVCSDPVTTAAKAATLRLEIDAVSVTGSTLALAGTYGLGAVETSAGISALNTFTDSETLSIVATSTTAFSEGSFNIYLVIKQTS